MANLMSADPEACLPTGGTPTEGRLPEMKHLKRVVAVATLSIGALALMVGPAAADVTVVPGEAEAKSFAILSFSVPNERDDLDTVKVEVQMPRNKVIRSVSVQPKPGWTVTITKRTLDKPMKNGDETVSEVVDTITWEGGVVGPGEFDLFTISAGPMPKNGSHLEFKTLQTYSDGEVVRWIESTPESGDEPENPAPTLDIGAESGEEHGH